MMKYFAYGSNMSLARLRERTPSARRVATCSLDGHALRFHKSGRDGSGKCDARATGNPADVVIGALFDICPSQKPALDRAEGLGVGYDQKVVLVTDEHGGQVEAVTYCAIAIDELLRPYSWYKHHVLVGARESSLPDTYIARIEQVESLEDPDRERDARERAIHLIGAPINNSPSGQFHE